MWDSLRGNLFVLHANSNAQTYLRIRAVDSLHLLSIFKTYKASLHDMFSTYLSCVYVRGNISYLHMLKS